MKKMMTIGGLLGFGSGLLLALSQNCSWPAVLWRSSAAALAAGLLLRWWGKVWLVSLQQSFHERSQAAMAAEAQAASSPPPSKRP
jgi:hypothetical protein